MTCIVGKPGQIAADSRDTGNIKRTCVKLFPRHAYLVGGAGDSGVLNVLEHVLTWPTKLSVAELTAWVHGNHDQNNLNFDQVELVLVGKRRVWIVEGRAVCESAVVGAVGSGAPYALGYLEARPNDLDGAVAAACKFDPYCAGPIRKLSLSK